MNKPALPTTPTRFLLVLFLLVSFLSAGFLTASASPNGMLKIGDAIETEALSAITYSAVLTDTATSTNTAMPTYTTEPTYTATPSQTTAPTQIPPAATVTQPPPASYARPVIVIKSYTINPDHVEPGKDLALNITLYNTGQKMAKNTKAIFTTGELIPRETGGVIVLGEIAPDNRKNLSQPLTASMDVWGKRITSITMNLSYQDDNGTSYEEVFTITLPVSTPAYVVYTPTPTPTATLAPVLRPQIIIANYTTDLKILQPGNQFKLSLGIQNVGNSNAERITMIVGGGSSSGGNYSGTQEPGGTNGTGGDFSVFAPVGASNIQSLNNLEAGASTTATQPLIVNVTANPGAYSFRISFSYIDEKGRSFTDDQVITLLVYSLPLVDVDFYQTPAGFFVGQSNPLPLQAVNLGRKSAILGNMRITAQNAEMMNNVTLVGNLEPGGYFPLDAMIIPSQPGPLDLIVTIDYTDDFNQPQTISKTISIEVQDAPVVNPVEPGGIDGKPSDVPVDVPTMSTETLLQKILRFLRGLFGLDSAPVTPTTPEFSPMNPESSGGEQVVPIQPSKPLKGP